MTESNEILRHDICIDDVDDKVWEALTMVNHLLDINLDFDRAIHSELLIDIRTMIANRLAEEKKYIEEI